MANEFDFLEDEDNEENDEGTQSSTSQDSGPAELRKALRTAQKELKELRDFRSAQEGERRKSELGELLAAAGVNPNAAKYFPKDKAVSKDEVEAWLAEDGELFGVQVTSDQVVDDSDRAQIEAVQRATRTAPTHKPGSYESAIQAFADSPVDNFAEDLAKAIEAFRR